MLRRAKLICFNDKMILYFSSKLINLDLYFSLITTPPDFLIRLLKNLWSKINLYQIVFHLMKKILILRYVSSKFHMLAKIQSGLLTVYPNLKNASLILNFGVLLDTYKVNRYFQLKSKTAHALSSNVMYQFTCSCDTNLSYIGMSTRHLGTRTG